MSANKTFDQRSSPRGIRLIAIRILNLIGKPFGINPFPRSFPNFEMADATDRAGIFDRIYSTNFWASSESRSGVGSESRLARHYSESLRQCLLELDAHSLFDAPCGDLNWIVEIARDPRLAYRGGDISQSLIQDLRRRHPDLSLIHFDICSDPLPDADVWHCRDCLFHLPFADIRKALENFVKSNVSLALLTTHRARLHRNLDVGAGGFRYLDLERPPISLPPAERYLKDFRIGLDFPRYVGLWRKEAISNALAQWEKAATFPREGRAR